MDLQAAFGKGGIGIVKGAGAGIGKSLGAGFGAAMINFGIAQWAKSLKKGHIKEVEEGLKKARMEDRANGVGITAIKA